VWSTMKFTVVVCHNWCHEF